MLLRPFAIVLVVSPVACMKVDWTYTDHRSAGDSAKEGAADVGEGQASLFVDLPAKIDLGDDKVAFKIWPVGDCEGTKDERKLAAGEFPYTLVVDSSCDYKMTFALGADNAGEPVEVLGEDLADAGADGLVVDVALAKASGSEDVTATATGSATATGQATNTATGTGTGTGAATANGQTGELGIKEFRIAAGTGNKAWNTQATPIVARIGDTVRIYNDDTATHRLHTNGRPCRHGNDIRPGQFGDCVIQSQFEGDLYDHITNGAVFFRVSR